MLLNNSLSNENDESGAVVQSNPDLSAQLERFHKIKNEFDSAVSRAKNLSHVIVQRQKIEKADDER